jgi:hypothetical protein
MTSAAAEAMTDKIAHLENQVKNLQAERKQRGVTIRRRALLVRMKKNAKELKKIVPQYFSGHNPKLSECQEIVARMNRFPNWHVAVTYLSSKNEGSPEQAVDESLDCD